MKILACDFCYSNGQTVEAFWTVRNPRGRTIHVCSEHRLACQTLQRQCGLDEATTTTQTMLLQNNANRNAQIASLRLRRAS